MRWWRNKPNARSAVSRLCNPWIYLVPWQLTTFARLGTLSHFDLNVISIDEVFTRHAKSARSNLLNCRTLGIAVAHDFISLGIFTAFARVALCPNAIHRNCKRLVHFCRN